MKRHGTLDLQPCSVCPYHAKVLYVSESSVRTLTSPNYPSPYDSNEDCKWILEAPSELIVKVTFQAFELAGDMYFYSSCRDKLIFYDGNDTTSNILGTAYCGATPPDLIYSTGRHLFVEFSTDRYTNRKGFKLSVSAVNKGK